MKPLSRATAVCAAVIGLASASIAAAADPVYKSTMPDGRVIYGESAMQGARRVDRVAAPPESAGIITATPEEKSRAASMVTPSGGVTVIPQPARAPVQPAQQAYTANPDKSLSRRSY